MKVSVCIPTYNQSLYIEQAVRSAFQQSHPPFEIIVSNDCSTDATAELLEKLKKEISILKMFNQPVNIGMVPNTDAVLRLATGDFIVKLDSDDYLHANYIETLGNLLLKYPEAGYAHAAVKEIDEQGNITKTRSLVRSTGFYSSQKALKDAIYGYQVAANIIMFRRSALAKVEYITAKTNFAEDYYLSAILAAAGFGNVYSNEIHSSYRVWNDAGMVRQKRKLAEIIALRQVFDEVLEPAYKKRNWSLKKLRNSRTNFACRQADCLSWSIYNFKEKEELISELRKLSSTSKARLFASAYASNFGKILLSLGKLKAGTRQMIKTVFYPAINYPFKQEKDAGNCNASYRK
jgi:glycosyltransferase involved in cell wall biosynthesis